MHKIISAIKVGQNKYKRVTKFVLTRDEITILVIGAVVISYIIIRIFV